MPDFARFMPKGTNVTLVSPDGKEETFELRPLPFKYIHHMFRIAKAFGSVEKVENEEEKAALMLEKMDKDTLESMNEIVMRTLEISYPNEKKEQLEAFASANMFSLLEPILQINQRGMMRK